MKCSLRTFGLILLCCYVVTYIAWSRIAFARADAMQFGGFYFVEPMDEVSSRVNRVCVFVFWPLWQLDVLIGLGRMPACDPLLTLSACFIGSPLRPKACDRSPTSFMHGKIGEC